MRRGRRSVGSAAPRTWLAVASWALAGIGCEQAPVAPPTASTAPTATSSSSAVSPAPKVTVMFDDTKLDVEVTGARSLRDVLPERGRDPSTWRELGARSVDGKRTLGVKQFADKYPAHEVRLFIDDGGRPSVGIFRAIDDAMPTHVRARLTKPHIVLVDVATVTVRTMETPAPAEPALTPLKVSFDGSERELSVRDLAALTEASPPGRAAGRGRNTQKGWPLAAVVGLVTKLESVAFVKIVGGDDSIVVKGEALRQKDALGLLRHNRRGVLSFMIWETGERSKPRRVRKVSQLVVASK